MENTKSKVKKETYKDRFLEKLKYKYSNISKFYYFSVLLISCCSLVIAWLLLANNGKTAKFSEFFELYGIKQFSVVVVLFVVSVLLSSLLAFLKVYSKGNKNKFYATLSGVVNSDFYKNTSLYGGLGQTVLFGKLTERNIKENLACDVAYSKKIFEKIAFVILGVVVLIWSLFVMEKIKLWLYFIVLMIVIINALYISLILITKKNKTKGIAIVSKICKILYDVKIISDYEKTFNKMADGLLIKANSFNYGKSLIWVEIASNLLNLFLKVLVIYLAMVNLVLTDSSVLGEVIIKCFMLEAIFMAYPLPKGLLIYEILFIFLFSSIIPYGFVYFVMLIFRIYDVFLPFVNYLIISVVDCVVYKNKKKIKDEKSIS